MHLRLQHLKVAVSRLLICSERPEAMHVLWIPKYMRGDEESSDSDEEYSVGMPDLIDCQSCAEAKAKQKIVPKKTKGKKVYLGTMNGYFKTWLRLRYQIHWM